MRTTMVIVLTAALTAGGMRALETQPALAHEVNDVIVVKGIIVVDELDRGVCFLGTRTDGNPFFTMIGHTDTPFEETAELTSQGLAAIDADGNGARFEAGPRKRAIQLYKPNGRIRYRK